MTSKDNPSYHALTFRRGETRPIPLVYRPRDKSLPPYDLTGKPVEMRIKPKGEAEIIFTAPEIEITDAPGGEITIEIPGETVAAWTFQNAEYAVILDGKRLIYGSLTIKSVYE